MAQPPRTPGGVSKADTARFLANYKDEADGVALYRLLAAAERDEKLRDLFESMAQTEERHLALWERKLREVGIEPPPRKPSTRVKILGWLAGRFGTRVVTPIVSRMEMSASGKYTQQPEAVADGLPADERSHAAAIRQLGRSRGGSAGAQIAQLEGRHRSASGNALRAGILGFNDGLVSNFSLVSGVAGADPGRDIVFLAGVGGLLAGAFSMALGEWISVRSSAEAMERQIAIEAEELALMPEEEIEELSLIYQAKGLSPAVARETAERLVRDPERALKTLAQEELGMSLDDIGSPWVAAGTSFVLFIAGAVVPVAPWAFGGGTNAVVASAALSGLGLFGAGAAITLATGRNAWYSGARMLALGLAAAAITFGVGKVVGVSVE
ncbi:MAG: demethoxyubiquinone hydroxylase family protein [Dehalococcoidia bacterium]